MALPFSPEPRDYTPYLAIPARPSRARTRAKRISVWVGPLALTSEIRLAPRYPFFLCLHDTCARLSYIDQHVKNSDFCVPFFMIVTMSRSSGVSLDIYHSSSRAFKVYHVVKSRPGTNCNTI